MAALTWHGPPLCRERPLRRIEPPLALPVLIVAARVAGEARKPAEVVPLASTAVHVPKTKGVRRGSGGGQKVVRRWSGGCQEGVRRGSGGGQAKPASPHVVPLASTAVHVPKTVKPDWFRPQGYALLPSSDWFSREE
eukprot:1183287-Prorocentrum_minimum.AAC.4